MYEAITTPEMELQHKRVMDAFKMDSILWHPKFGYFQYEYTNLDGTKTYKEPDFFESTGHDHTSPENTTLYISGIWFVTGFFQYANLPAYQVEVVTRERLKINTNS